MAKQICDAPDEENAKRNVLAEFISTGETYISIGRRVCDWLMTHKDLDWAKLNLIIGDESSGSVNVMRLYRYSKVSGYCCWVATPYGRQLDELIARPTGDSGSCAYMTLDYNIDTSGWSYIDHSSTIFSSGAKMVLTI